MKNEQELELLKWAYKGNVDAINCALIISRCSQTLDDLWDKDKDVSGPDAVSMMLAMTVDLVRNPFYLKNQASFVRIIERAIMQWVEANDLEAEQSGEHIHISYIIRSSVTDAIIEIAYLLGDRQWGRVVAKKIRQAVFSDNESFEEYKKEILGGSEACA